MRWGLILPIGLLAACSNPADRAVNRWADERFWALLEAQDLRDTERLCALMEDSSALVRESAALAFASAQSSVSIPCLLKALNDPQPRVRATAAFALGFVADSSVWSELPDIAMNETDTAVQRALLSASFLAMQRTGRLTDPNAILHYLRSSHGHERVRAADALRRLSDSLVQKAGSDINAMMSQEGTEVRQFLILAMRKLGTSADIAELQRIAREGIDFGERVNAVRVCGKLMEGGDGERLLWNAVWDEAAGDAALAWLAERLQVDARASLRHALESPDTLMRIAMLGLAMKHGEERTADSARAMLNAIAAVERDAFRRAAVTAARAEAPQEGDLSAFVDLMQGDLHPMERQAAFQGAMRIVRGIMMRSRYASREAQYAQLSEVAGVALSSGDAGLISAAAELIAAEESDAIRLLLPPALESKARSALEPLRDLEALLLLDQAVAKRDGLPRPAHRAPPFNHPIDKAKLRTLKQGQRYRIVTNKGVIVIATDVDECPGSSLAFDSLVTAGYYNGKAFHRVVPNFVIQGGCPRGDGYGGMPWTLRTEIGRSSFTAGSVGLASAGRDTESCQFFITHSVAPHLDGRYTRFGEVVEGMEVVWRIQVGDRMLRVEQVM
ncbi:MAG: peptidylprolyl isomerase [Flavobacteriales bacterium]|nr:peptidylprolyl isomerase [Flavobacteriales bacterium]